MDVDLSYRDIQIIIKLLREKHTAQWALTHSCLHVHHFPERVTQTMDIDSEALRHCRNPWCEAGQLNIITDTLEKARDKIEARIKRELDPVGSYVRDVDAAVKEGRIVSARKVKVS